MKNLLSYTENGSLAHHTTFNNLLDFFALGGSYRNHSDEDCILLFKKACADDLTYALRCLFYLRDVRGGQGERRFFRVCFKWFAENHPNTAIKLLPLIPEYGRWDDLIYSTIDSPAEAAMVTFVHSQLYSDLNSETPSLLAKWLPSENASSPQTKRAATLLRTKMSFTPKDYRKTLSALRTRINILEKLMSENKWDSIDFSKIPSKAGLVYRNAFIRNPITSDKYISFIKDSKSKVNADTLYPYEIIEKLIDTPRADTLSCQTLEKYWDNLPPIEADSRSLVVLDTSGSMRWRPLCVGISLALLLSKDCYISFSSRPQLVPIEGIDLKHKIDKIVDKMIIENTNLESVFTLLKQVYRNNKEEMPKNIIIVSDMEIDAGTSPRYTQDMTCTLMETMRKEWAADGLILPRLVYWNVDARNNTFLDSGDNVSFVSGFSPTIYNQIILNKNGYDLCMEVLNQERYAVINV